MIEIKQTLKLTYLDSRSIPLHFSLVSRQVREAATKVIFLVAWSLRGGGGKGLATKKK